MKYNVLNKNCLKCIIFFQIMKECNINNIIFSSSATVYGLPQYLPIDENHPTGQGITNPYAHTKNMCEQIMKDVCASDLVSCF